MNIMKMRMVIYMALNTVNGKVYIGKTTGLLDKRIRKHKSDSKIDNGYFQRSIRKYGWEVFKWSMLEQCETEEELNDLEYHYIQQYKRFGNGVMNMTDGGDGACGAVRSYETRQKIRESKLGNKHFLGKTHSDETKQKIRVGREGKTPNLGNKHSDETKQKMSEWIRSDETKQKMRESQLGKTHSEEAKQKIRESMCKFTYKITRPDGTIDIAINLNQYCKQNSLDQGGMYTVASGKAKHHKGFRVERIEKL